MTNPARDPAAPPPAADTSSNQVAEGRWRRWEAALSDRLNPILVKEARQGLKSRLFVFTFFAALLFAWGWSVLGVALVVDPTFEDSEAGLGMFLGYCAILAFPLLVIGPQAAYRSMVNEWEDATYELMSITSLEAGHIVRGKLGSALLQMMLYAAVFLPCIGFTYLLGGVSLLSIAVGLVAIFAGSVFATQLGLCLATLSRNRGGQMLLSVLFLVALLGLYWMVLLFVGVLLLEEGGNTASSPELWYGLFVTLTLLASYGYVLYQLTRSRLLFPSENRTTALRLALLVPPALWLAAWLSWVEQGEDLGVDMLLGILIGLFIHWAAVLLIIGGEAGEISQRIRRRVPRSVLGRLFGLWLLPGPRLGYFYVLLSATGMAVPWLLLLSHSDAGPLLIRMPWYIIARIAGAFWCYLAIYGGISAWLLAWLRRRVVVNMMLAAAVILLQVVVFCIVPLFVEVITASGIPFSQYSLLHLLNPIITVDELMANPAGGPEYWLMVLALPAVVVNVPGAYREMVLLYRSGPAQQPEPEAAAKEQPPEHPFADLAAGTLPSSAPQSSSS